MIKRTMKSPDSGAAKAFSLSGEGTERDVSVNVRQSGHVDVGIGSTLVLVGWIMMLRVLVFIRWWRNRVVRDRKTVFAMVSVCVTHFCG